MTELVEFSVHKGLGRIELADPERRNVLSFEMLQALSRALSEAGKDSQVHVLLLTGAGSVFSAGMDLKGIRLEIPEETQQFADTLSEAYEALLRLPVPLVCAVDGPALGGAVGLAMAGDLVWMGPMAHFAFPETRVGLVPAMVSVVARRRISNGNLALLGLTAMKLEPGEAVRLGLADFAARADATAEAEAFARRMLRDNSHEAMRRTKAFLQAESLSQLGAELERAKLEFRSAVVSAAAERGLAAFREKRIVDWSGSDE